MKQRREIKHLLLLPLVMLVALIATSCSEDIATALNGGGKGYELPVSVSATYAGDAATRTAYNADSKTISFTEGDKLFIKGSHETGGLFAGTLDYDVSSGKFSGTITLAQPVTTNALTIFGETEEISATLIPSGSTYLTVTGEGSSAELNVDETKAVIATDRSSLIAQFGRETANAYDATTGFALTPKNAILHLNFSDMADYFTSTVNIGISYLDGSNERQSLNTSENMTAVTDYYLVVEPNKTYTDMQVTLTDASTSSTQTVKLNDMAIADPGKVYKKSTTIFDPYTTPLTFEAPSSGSGVIVTIKNPNSLTIKYSLDDAEKVEASGNIEFTIPAGKTAKLYGNNATYWSESASTTITFNAPCYVYGNIMSLISESGFATAVELTKSNNFNILFKRPDNDDSNNYHYLQNHPYKDIVLPATTLTTGCYNGLFARCKGLTRAPKLPATTMADNCYGNMFFNCTGLTEAPVLPATTLCENCYSAMFGDCTSLTKAPKLPATTLADCCYGNMFSGCTNLTEAPELPATTMKLSCYTSMFSRCTSLKKAPKLPATTLAQGCYETMFQECTSLDEAWVKKDFTKSNEEMNHMFTGCASPGTLHTGATTDTNWKAAQSEHLPEGWKIKLDYTE